MRRRTILAFLVLLIGAFAFAAVGCGGDDDDGDAGDTSAAGDGGSTDFAPVTALPSSSCSDIEYGGEGDPDVLIASDLPMQGASRTQTLQMVGAITYLLEKNGWKAGDKNVAFQACDDATAQAAKWDPGKCSQNANAYAQNPSLVAVLGTFNSGCAAIEIPVLNQAPGGGMLLLSAANTYGCLTEPCEGDEPEKYYPSGERTYARVAPSDPNQGAIQAQFAQENGIESVYILNDKEAYGLGVAKNFQGAAEFLGIEVKGFAAYDPTASNFEATFTKIKGTNPDAVFVGGLVDENSGQLIEDKVAVLGPNDGDVKLLLPDGFYTSAIFDPGEGGTPEANGAFFSVAGAPIEDFTGKGATFAEEFGATLGGDAIDPYAIYAVQSADILLNAIANSDGSRPGIIDEVFNTTVEDGYTGTFEINENGDVANAGGAVVTFVVSEGVNDELKTVQTMTPELDVVDAARQAAAGR